ncbi:hypothetical protein [Lysinibacillus sp. 3P01SB]|uniref:hypothetical protein n=1 Tax=Lysinibacillus sp. 3P01SB TaxID=3132284 RepID=UPI0039A45A62
MALFLCKRSSAIKAKIALLFPLNSWTSWLSSIKTVLTFYIVADCCSATTEIVCKLAEDCSAARAILQ